LNATDDEAKRDVPFQLIVDDIFFIKGRGVVIVGLVKSGVLKKGQTVHITGGSKPSLTAQVSGIALINPPRLDGKVDIFFRDIHPDQIEVGMLLTSENVIG
jgi:translation elongation factor EF-Tu-like GTPase